MQEYSQITFDFFTPPTEEVKRLAAVEQLADIESTTPDVLQEPVTKEEIVDVVFPEQTLKPSSEISGPAVETLGTEESMPAPLITAIVKSTRGRKSLKSFALAADLVNIPEDEILFQKHYYSIGEVSEMFDVNASLLRFWESEFDIIQPKKNKKGDRHFRPVDIKNLELIYDLLRRRKLTIDGAKDFLKRNSRAKERFEVIQNLRKIRSFLVELKASL